MAWPEMRSLYRTPLEPIEGVSRVAAKAVWMAYVSFCGEDGEAYLSARTLAAMVDLPETTAQRIRNALVEAGYLEATGRVSKFGSQIYTLRPPAVLESAEPAITLPRTAGGGPAHSGGGSRAQRDRSRSEGRERKKLSPKSSKPDPARVAANVAQVKAALREAAKREAARARRIAKKEGVAPLTSRSVAEARARSSVASAGGELEPAAGVGGAG